MNDNEHKEIFFNRADVEWSENVSCDNCFERLVFFLKDKDYEFSMGLSSVLECLIFAIEQGELPKLLFEWLSLVDSIYRTNYSSKSEIIDHEYKKK